MRSAQPMAMQRRAWLLVGAPLALTTLAGWGLPARAGGSPAASAAPHIALVYMGGPDCPPCVVWRAIELPKLRQTPEFQTIEFFYVQKFIQGAVPPRWMLDDRLKPLKDKLDVAGNRMHGSPQTVIVVNGEVHDYIFGTVAADELVQIIRALRLGQPYPRPRCIKRQNPSICLVQGA